MAKLYWITEEIEGEEPHRYLGEEGDSKYCEKGSEVVAGDLSADVLAQYLDDQAENENYHSIVGVHAKLAVIIRKYCDDSATTAILREIAEAGGLPQFAV
jgi:hypothetical protein